MNSNSRWIFIVAGISGFLAVLAGAAAAHWLVGSLAAEDIARIDKAATYQMYHTLALLILAQMPKRFRLPACLFTLGILLFSGSLYLYAFTHLKLLVYLTPLGGLSFMAGWLSISILAMKE